MSEALLPNAQDYPSFSAFFTRRLKPDARPFEAQPNSFNAPCDGTVSQLGLIQQQSLLQAKAQTYRVTTLLSGCEAPPPGWRNKPLEQGSFINIYLSPRDYHRVHCPVDAELIEMRFIPGRLFSVAPAYVEQVPLLFCRNERLVFILNTSYGELAVVMVGAINVGAIEVPWRGQLKSLPAVNAQSWRYPVPKKLLQGSELGCFNLGSTVIVVSARRLEFDPRLGPGSRLRMGQNLGNF